MRNARFRAFLQTVAKVFDFANKGEPPTELPQIVRTAQKKSPKVENIKF